MGYTYTHFRSGHCFKMDKKFILFLLSLVSTILARPQDDDDYCEYCDDAPEPCSNYFEDATVLLATFEKQGFSPELIEENLRYTCVEPDLCRDNRNNLTKQLT